MNLSRVFIRRPIAVSLIAWGVALLGGVAYLLLPIATLPQVDYPTIQVTANFPGGSPETMATSVATPLERAFASIAGLKEMESQNSQNQTRIMLMFDLHRNINDAARDVQAAINAASGSLPSGMPDRPGYRKVDPSQSPVVALALTSDTLAPEQIYDYASTIVGQRLAQVPGVGQVNVGGGSLPAVRVQLDPNALSHYGIALDEVSNAISQVNLLRPLGSIEDGQRSWLIATDGQLRRAEDYLPLIVAYRDGAPVRLGDVARVTNSVENRYASGFHNDRDAVLVMITRQPGANIIETVDAIKEQLPRLRALLPPSVDMVIATDRSTGIRTTLAQARMTLLITFALVVLVVLLFLGRLRTTLIPAVVVPVCIVGTFAVMYLWGFSLNNLSLMALIVATGLLADDAIVVIENITRHVDAGLSPRRAALRAAQEIGFTLLATNLALVAVFVCILFMGGLVERLFREFSLTLAAALTLSLIASLTLTPSLASRWLRRSRDERPLPPALGIGQRVMARAGPWYDRSLAFVLRHRHWALLVIVLLIAGNVVIYRFIPKTFLPQQDTGQLGGFARGDDGLSFQVMQPKIAAYRKFLLEQPSIQDILGYIGGGTGVNNAYIMIRLKPMAERRETASDIVDRIRRETPKIPGGRMWLWADKDINIDLGGSEGEYQLTLLSGESSLLRQWEPKISDALRQLPELVDVEASGDEGARQITLDIDRDAARRLGVDTRMVTAVLNNSFSQRQIATLYDELNQYHVVMELDPKYTQSPTVLQDVYVIANDGRRVPLSAFSSYHYSVAPDRIRHNGPFASVRVSFGLATDVTFNQAAQAIDAALAKLMLPTDVQTRFEGQGRVSQAVEQNQVWLIVGVLLTVYLLLGVLYESLLHPLTILSALPCAGLGALLALWLLHIEFSLIALLGVFLLVGLVMKSTILMVDFALSAQRREGLGVEEAIRRAAALRLRPILMTSTAAMLGALPLMLAMGEGAEMRRPLGVTIAGGLLLSQLLTLYVTPVAFVYFSRMKLVRRWPLSMGTRSRAGGEVEAGG